jgi:Tfp pilus assembly protein PilE
MAMIVLGILAGIAVTNYNGIMISGAASAAEHNLMLIYS